MNHPPFRVLLRAVVAVGLLGSGVACYGAADVWLEGSLLDGHAEGWADDGFAVTPADSFGPGDRDLWAQDSLTTAYADPPRPGRLAGGVAAQPSDTVPEAGPPPHATARSLSRLVVPMEVRRTGRVRLEVVLRLSDVEIAGAGVPRVQVAAAILDGEGERLPGGEIGSLVLEIGPNGEVLVEPFEDDPDRLLPNGSYERVLSGPVRPLRLGTGGYGVRVDLSLEATAPAGSGGYQLARIGQASAVLRVEGM